MPIEVVDDSATISTSEYSLPGDTTTGVPTAQTAEPLPCILQVWIDLANLQAGDEFRCRLYEKINGAGATQRIVEEWTFAGAQDKPGWVMPSLIVAHGWDVTLLRTGGSDRMIGWSLRKIS